MNVKLLALGAALAAVVAPAQETIIRNARVIAISGPDQEKADVRIVDGRIAEIAPSLPAAPPRTAVIDARGRTLMPAYVLAHTSEGLDRANEAMDVTPFVSVLDAVDPTLPFFDNMLRDGVYTVNVMPGDRTVVGGMGRVLRPVGRIVEEMTIVAEPGLKISMFPPQGNRASHLAKLRAVLDDARRHHEARELAVDTRPTGNFAVDLEAMQIERRKEALVRLVKGRLPAFVSCESSGDVLRALDLAKEFGLDLRFVLQPGTWRAAKHLADAKAKVILTTDFVAEETDPETGKATRRILPKILHDAGVEFAVTTAQTSLGHRYLWYQASLLVRHGVPREVALKSVTLTPARILGLEASRGSIEVGKDADLLLLTDDPLSGRAWVDVGVADGKVVYERVKDRRLAELLGLGAETR